ncbi:hypothetical protein PVN26_22275, partial [Bacillus licheniformis]|uniref:hypothetical protein n=1 Tax=Bacillus licheniformis TaxID=1402 RepID=UPI00237CDAD6
IGGGDKAVDWSEIQNKPENFPPSSHTHPISQITNLQTTLNSKLTAKQAAAQADSTAEDIAGLVADFNALLAALCAAKNMEVQQLMSNTAYLILSKFGYDIKLSDKFVALDVKNVIEGNQAMELSKSLLSLDLQHFAEETKDQAEPPAAEPKNTDTPEPPKD